VNNRADWRRRLIRREYWRVSARTAASMTAPPLQILRHVLATIAYRGGKVVRDAPPAFGEFQSQAGVRTPAEILAHLGDLFEWAITTVEGREAWDPSAERAWPALVDRFFAAVERFDDRLRDATYDEPIARRLIQGPLADSLTHIGQLAMLRRMAGGPVGAEQAPPVREF
jgi:hypothetical protein